MRIGVMVIAVLFLSYETLKKQLNLNFDPKMEKIIGAILLGLAILFFIWGRRIREQNALEAKKIEILSDDSKKE